MGVVVGILYQKPVPVKIAGVQYTGVFHKVLNKKIKTHVLSLTILETDITYEGLHFAR